MKICKIGAVITAIVIVLSMSGCKKKEGSSGKLQMASYLTEDRVAEEAADDVGNTQSLVDPDRLLFTYEYRNSAWGFQYTVYAIYGDGRVYYYSLDRAGFTPPEFSKDDVDAVIDLTKDQPSYSYDQDFIEELYKLADAFDPDAEATVKRAMYDAGQTTLCYWDENMNKVILLNEGNDRYTYDDPNFEPIQKLWSQRYAHM